MFGPTILLAVTAMADRSPVAVLASGARAFRSGAYDEAARTLTGLAARLPRTADYAQYLAAESEFYAGRPERARALYETVVRDRSSRFAVVASWRAADCLWSEGRRADAGAMYRRLLRGAAPSAVDPVVARFRVAELAPIGEAPALFRQILVEHPAHPLAEEAGRRAGGAAPRSSSSPTAPPVQPDPSERLRRASLLAEGRRYQDALAELEHVHGELPSELAVERDFQRGMAKYHLRREYSQAAALLLGVAPHLPGDRASFAQFHGARALSRGDHDDEAIAEYRKVVERYPGSRWAAEAQFRAGWVDFNRGHYREAVPALEATLARYGRSPFADDAAWYLFFAHYLVDETGPALEALERYRRLSPDPDAAKRALYWRARTIAKQGGDREGEARGLLRECARRWPLHHYGLLARARLVAAGEPIPPPFEAAAPLALPAVGAWAARDPLVQRADQLSAAGLGIEAAMELERGEDLLVRRVGRDPALPLLLDRYGRFHDFHRAYQLAEARGAVALAGAPVGGARSLWQAAYPRAYPEIVDREATASGSPPLFLLTIMRKETAYSPFEVSYADARGLLQVLPEVGERMARHLGEPFHDDELYDPATNIRLGGHYIGLLVRKFQGQIFLAAAAFNGGVAATMRWCDLYGRRPLDEFVELVAYEQTREYVKRVIGIYAHYLYLYGGQIYELPLQIDPHYSKDDPVAL